MKTYLSTFALAIFLIPVCQAQRPAQGPVSVQKYTPQSLGYTKLIWQDEFNDEALDTSKWEIRGVGKRATVMYHRRRYRCRMGFSNYLH